MAESRTSRGVLEEYLFYKEIFWEIEIDLIEDENIIFSPFFNFAGADMRFSLYPNGTSRDPKFLCVHLLIPLETPQDTVCESSPQRIICDLTVQTKDSISNVRPTVEDRLWKKSSTLITYGFKKSALFKSLMHSLRSLKVSCILKLKEDPKVTLKREKNPFVTSTEDVVSSKDEYLTDFCSNDRKHFYTEKLIQDLNELLLNESDSDVTINVKGQDFRAHRNILGARTPVFTSMFKHDMTEKTNGIVIIEDCEPEIFKHFLKYLYTGEVDCQTENVCGLFQIADKYQVNELRAECLELMKNNLSVDTFCEVIEMALVYSEQELLKLTTDFFCENTKNILVTVNWQKFIIKNPLYSNELFLKALQ